MIYWKVEENGQDMHSKLINFHKSVFTYLTGWAVWLPSEADDSLQPAGRAALAVVPTELAGDLKTKKCIN
jgi:hypothetical protein